MRHALITGITGNDGSFLAELLLEKGYEVFAMARRESWHSPNNASHLVDRTRILFGDMGEGTDIATGIAFNHESERRPHHFLTQKVAYGAACAALGIRDSPMLNEVGKPLVDSRKLALGCFEIARDWGYAGDIVWAMWRMLQEPTPTDLVLDTGVLHSLADLCTTAYQSVGCDWRECIISDPSLVRPLDSEQTLANPTRARELLNWKLSTSFESMIQKMVEAQILRLQEKAESTPRASQHSN